MAEEVVIRGDNTPPCVAGDRELIDAIMTVGSCYAPGGSDPDPPDVVGYDIFPSCDPRETIGELTGDFTLTIEAMEDDISKLNITFGSQLNLAFQLDTEFSDENLRLQLNDAANMFWLAIENGDSIPRNDYFWNDPAG